MFKIVALNDEENDEAEEEEVVATKEAQETIAESEYVRAIKLKSDGMTDLCLDLLKELLQTQVLNENMKSNNNEKLWIIKYNCHKNIAIILEERCEDKLALQHYIAAILIDNTDVFTLHKFGQLALKLNAIDLAEYAFENCLVRNSAHWRAAEGMLQVMNNNHNIIGAYNWASKICCLDPNSQKATKTLQEITALFGENVSFFEKCGGFVRNEKSRMSPCETNFTALLNTSKALVKNEEFSCDKIPELNNFVIKTLSWYSFGQFIMNLYAHLKQDGQNMLFVFELNDIVKHNKLFDMVDNSSTTSISTAGQSKLDDNEVEQESNSEVIDITDLNKPPVNEQCDAQSMDSNNYDSDSNAKSDGCEASKSKPRRRCSDLHFLEQWGWHKNRRYSSRKKNERDEIDTSLNGYLRKILLKYTEKTFDEKWPFNENSKCVNTENFDSQCSSCKTFPSDDSFQIATKYEFNQFINKLMTKRMDLMVLVYKWLKYLSLFWEMPMPDKLKTLYIDIFNIYMLHFDLSTWNQLTPNNFEASCRICLLYLELDVKNNLRNNSDQWLKVFNHLLFNIGTYQTIATRDIKIYELRLIYLKYLLFNEKCQFDECLLCLQQMQELFSKQKPSFVLHLPNSNCVCINTQFIENAQFQYKRQIDVNNVPKLYENGSWSQLTEILISSIESRNNNFVDENWLKDFIVEIEILLQSLWNLSSYENCLMWSEKCFHFAVSSYLDEPKSTLRQKLLAELINFITSYIEAIILNEGFHIVTHLNEENLSRLVQNIIRILVYQFEGTFDKNGTHGLELNFKRPWIILHQLVLREENDSPTIFNAKYVDGEDVTEIIPNSFLILFTAHEYLGKRQWCTNDNGEFLQYILDAVVLNLKAPIYDVCRDVIYEYIEQITYCLFKYPQKKARSRHLEDHEASEVKLKWPKAVQIFDLYRPEDLPEFNSYKLESISSDMEQLLLKIILLMPKELDPSKSIHNVTLFIEGQNKSPPVVENAFKMPYKIISLFYLLADFYFKNRDFIKAIKFYTLDLAVNPTRFDSWAGMALSKASKIETKLNGLDPISLEVLWVECEEVLRCFECCINLNRFQTLLWIEYGSFSYTIHSYFSRYLKYNSKKLSVDVLSSIEERKAKMLTIAYNCFSCANSLQNSATAQIEESSDANDEKWLCQYMLGKISEKRKEEPKVYLNHYFMAANYLYEYGATYPIKINHSNPTTLSVEALEVFYRINAAIIKYLEQGKEISRCTGDLFSKILKNLSTSPFAYNKAKIDGNCLNILKGKVFNKFKQPGSNTTMQSTPIPGTEVKNSDTGSIKNADQTKEIDEIKQNANQSQKELQENASATIMISSSATSSAISSDSSTVESESDSDDSLTESETHKPINNEPFTAGELNLIYRMVVQNIEECATRFPEHYKSIYRLIHHYMNSPPDNCDLQQSEELLVGQYKTSLGNLVNGLFYDRKNNNLFNGIWRIPSSEIDRPGSFSTHLVKCVTIFIQLLFKTNNHKILMDIALNLYKNPDLDKRYITDAERKELCQQSINYTVQILRDIYQKNIDKRDDTDTLDLLIEIYKIHKKCIKYMNQKEPIFTKLLIEVYKFFIKNKVDQVPENCNYLDLAIKLCVQEITAQKCVDKSNNSDNTTNTSDYIVIQSTNIAKFSNTPTTRTFNIPGLNMRLKSRASTSKTLPVNLPNSSAKTDTQNSPNLLTQDFMKSPQFISMMALFGGGNQLTANDTPEFQKIFEECYTKILENERNALTTKSLFGSKPRSDELEKQQTSQTIPNSLDMLPSSSKMATIQNVAKCYQPINVSGNVSAASTDIKHQSKAKSSIKMKTAYKPYNRSVESDSFINKNIHGLSKNFNLDALSNHAHMLTSYLSSHPNATTTLPQIDFANKNSGIVGRKTKSPRSESTDTSSFMNAPKSMKDFHSILAANQIPDETTSFGSLGFINSSQFVPPMQNFSPQCSVNTASPTKTLQQKLAERQKACQINESNTLSSTTSTDDKSNVDIIILD